MSKAKMSGLVVLFVAVIFLCGGVFTAYSYANGQYNTGVKKETALSAEYKNAQNYLSSYILGFQEHTGINVVAGSELANIFTAAAAGQVGKDGLGTDSALFIAVQQNYPQSGMAELMQNWGKVQDYITSQREGFRNEQTKVLSMIQDYDLWRGTGLVTSQIVRIMGFPSNKLEAGIGTDVVYGEAALNRIKVIVLDTGTVNAYQTGIQAPLTVPGVPTQAK